MNGRDMMPACARIAAVDPTMADRMWNTTTDDDGRDLVDERMRGKGRVLCAACPMRLDCISRALVNGWKDKAVYGGLDYASRWILARLIARDLHIADGGLHRIPRSRVRDWLADHPDWAERMRRDGRDYWRRTKRVVPISQFRNTMRRSSSLYPMCRRMSYFPMRSSIARMQ